MKKMIRMITLNLVTLAAVMVALSPFLFGVAHLAYWMFVPTTLEEALASARKPSGIKPLSAEMRRQLVDWDQIAKDYFGNDLIRREILADTNWLAKNAEPSFHEVKTTEFVVNFFIGEDVEVHRRYIPVDGGNIVHAVIVVIRNGPGRRVVNSVETDALIHGHQEDGELDVRHSCFHHLHLQGSLKAAKLRARNREGWSGTYTLVVRGAEEKGAGIKALLDAGFKEEFGPWDSWIALHSNPALPAGTVGITQGQAMSMAKFVEVCFEGKGGHAGVSEYSQNSNTATGYLLVEGHRISSRLRWWYGIPTLSLHHLFVSLEAGQIRGGTAPNIVPLGACSQWSLRTYNEADQARAEELLAEAAFYAAEQVGLPRTAVDIKVHMSLPSLWNSERLVNLSWQVLPPVLGEHKVVPFLRVKPSDDVAYVEKLIYLWFGVAFPEKYQAILSGDEPFIVNHHPDAQGAPESVYTAARAILALSQAEFLLPSEE